MCLAHGHILGPVGFKPLDLESVSRPLDHYTPQSSVVICENTKTYNILNDLQPYKTSTCSNSCNESCSTKSCLNSGLCSIQIREVTWSSWEWSPPSHNMVCRWSRHSVACSVSTKIFSKYHKRICMGKPTIWDSNYMYTRHKPACRNSLEA